MLTMVIVLKGNSSGCSRISIKIHIAEKQRCVMHGDSSMPRGKVEGKDAVTSYFFIIGILSVPCKSPVTGR